MLIPMHPPLLPDFHGLYSFCLHLSSSYLLWIAFTPFLILWCSLKIKFKETTSLGSFYACIISRIPPSHRKIRKGEIPQPNRTTSVLPWHCHASIVHVLYGRFKTADMDSGIRVLEELAIISSVPRLHRCDQRSRSILLHHSWISRERNLEWWMTPQQQHAPFVSCAAFDLWALVIWLSCSEIVSFLQSICGLDKEGTVTASRTVVKLCPAL